MKRWLYRFPVAGLRLLRRLLPASQLSAGLSVLLVGGLIVGGTVVAFDRRPAAPGGTGAARGGAAVRRPAIRPVVRRIVLPPARDKVTLPPRRAQRFSLLGLTWTDPHARLDGDVQVRTRSVATGRWHTWTIAGGERASDAPGPAVRGGTDPVWVGESDGVALRVNGRTASRLPAGLRLDLVDPGRAGASSSGRPAIALAAYTAGEPSTSATAPLTASISPTSPSAPPTGASPTTASLATTSLATASLATTSPSAVPPSTTSASTTSTSPTSTSPTSVGATSPSATSTSPTSPTSPTEVAPPLMVPRSGWQADETLRRSAPVYADAAKVVFVHHTDTTNDYACSQSAAIIRSLYGYHVLSLGWNDIGYNFLVDRCGTLFEGRYGGADRPVIGAHTYGFNTNSTGVAVIGTFTTTPAPAVVLDTLARLAAWKLALGAIVPSTTSRLTEAASDSHGFTLATTYAFAAVSGHRDGYATECPGDGLYAQLPQLRALAAQDAGSGGLAVTGISGATSAGGRWYTTGRLTIGWTSTGSADQVAGYDVLVDGRPVLSAASTARSAAVAVPTGSHAVAVRARYQAAAPTPAAPVVTTTGSATTEVATTGPIPSDGLQVSASPSAAPQSMATAAVTVVSDATPPVFTTVPTVGVRTGTVTTTSAPVSLTWRATDNALLAKVTASGSTTATFGATATRWNTLARPASGTVSVTAYDVAGNARTVRTSGRITLHPVGAGARTGRWTIARSAAYLGGAALATSSRNATLTWNFTGRGVAWIAERSATSGQAAIYLDGVRVGLVDLGSAAATHRQAVWVRNGLTRGRHVLRIVVLATAHRPTVVTDGVVTVA